MECFICHKDLNDIPHSISDDKEKYPLIWGAPLTEEGIQMMDVNHYCNEHWILKDTDIKDMGHA